MSFLILADISHEKNQSSIIIAGTLAQRSWLIYEKIAPQLPSSILATGGVIGWAEYDFQVSDPGWYKFSVPIVASYNIVRYTFDGQNVIPNNDWIWLAAGAHSLRAESYFWTGWPSITTFRLEKAQPADGPGFRLLTPSASSFRAGQSPDVTLSVGGDSTSYNISRSGDIVDTIAIASTTSPYAVTLHLSRTPGDHHLSLTRSGGTSLTQTFDYTVFDVAQVEPAFTKGSLLQTIDLKAVAPDYTSGSTTIATSAAGAYRQSDQYGFTLWQRTPAAQRNPTHPPSWFAYTLTLPDVSQPFILEIDYPDDAPRGEVVAIRTPANQALTYPVSIALETGDIWPLSGKMTTRDVLFWASDIHPRVVVMNVNDGYSAAASTIRVYAAIESETPVSTRPVGKREFVFWYEEGANFDHLVNISATGIQSFNVVDRWLREIKFFGGTTVMPTVAVYGAQLYPSSFLLTFNPTGRDLLRAILLDAERLGLKVIAQLYPRSDEALWNIGSNPTPHMLLSRYGLTQLLDAGGSFVAPPYFNPLDPYVQDWYVGVVGELADRYKDFPAFEGIDLRAMPWANSALNNLVNLDWGYDYATVASFARDSGITIPANLIASGQDDTVMAPQRYAFIIPTYQQQWVNWRCGKIRDLYARLRDRVRAANPNLKLSTSIFAFGNRTPTDLLNAGLDPSLLRGLAGVTLIDAVPGYGRKESDLTLARTAYDYIKEPSNFTGFSNIFITMEYIESVGDNIPSSVLGLPPTPGVNPWSSSASNPPGRLYLERFAIMLGNTDALMLGDGGNGYVFSSTSMREFQQQYRLLPAVHFNRVHAPDTISLWQQGFFFYVVNMTNFPVNATIYTSPSNGISRADGLGILSTTVQKGKASALVSLQPYQLLVFQTTQQDAILTAEASLQPRCPGHC